MDLFRTRVSRAIPEDHVVPTTLQSSLWPLEHRSRVCVRPRCVPCTKPPSCSRLARSARRAWLRRWRKRISARCRRRDTPSHRRRNRAPFASWCRAIATEPCSAAPPRSDRGLAVFAGHAHQTTSTSRPDCASLRARRRLPRSDTPTASWARTSRHPGSFTFLPRRRRSTSVSTLDRGRRTWSAGSSRSWASPTAWSARASFSPGRRSGGHRSSIKPPASDSPKASPFGLGTRFRGGRDASLRGQPDARGDHGAALMARGPR